MLKGHKYCIYCGFKLDLAEEGYCNECGKTNKYIHEYPNIIAELEKILYENHMYTEALAYACSNMCKANNNCSDCKVGYIQKQLQGGDGADEVSDSKKEMA